MLYVLYIQVPHEVKIDMHKLRGFPNNGNWTDVNIQMGSGTMFS